MERKKDVYYVAKIKSKKLKFKYTNSESFFNVIYIKNDIQTYLI